MTNFSELVGNNAGNRLTGASYTIAYGLGGDDLLSSSFAAPYQWLYGGEDDDLYIIGRGHVASVYDDAGRDTVEINGASFNDANTFLLTLDNRHLVFSNEATGTEAYLLEYRSSSIDTVVLDDTVVGYETLLDVLTTRPNYLGDFSYEELRAQGIDLPPTFEARQDVADAVFREGQLQDEADRFDALAVARLYGGAFGRQPDVEGVNFWIDQAEKGQSRLEAAFYFLDSPEFTFNFGDDDRMSNERFVDVMYNNVLGRGQDASGFDFWVRQMDNGLSREETLIYFADSAENIARSGYLDSFREVSDGDWAFVI